jgi:hypothetical protein
MKRVKISRPLRRSACARQAGSYRPYPPLAPHPRPMDPAVARESASGIDVEGCAGEEQSKETQVIDGLTTSSPWPVALHRGFPAATTLSIILRSEGVTGQF